MIFASPLMLIGLAAAAVPLLLHLLSRVRAKEEPFPTLRFLQQCMEKTARRRRIEHWLLMLLRCGVLAVLATALAEPISRATGWFGGGDDVAVLLVDDSYSMSLSTDGQTRLARAKSDAGRVLRDSDAPATATVLTTAGAKPQAVLSARLDATRRRVDAAQVNFGPNDLSERFARAVEQLAGQSNPKRSIYYFGDLQRRSMVPLFESPALRRAKDMRLFFLDAARGPVNNVGIMNLSVVGSCIAGAPVTFRVTIFNSSPAPRRVDVAFRPDGAKTSRKITQFLAPAGRDGAEATLTFTHRFAQPGWSLGEVRIEQADDLLADNHWRYCVDVAPHARALVVRGAGKDDPGAMLSLALDWRSERQADRPWPIRVTDVQAADFIPELLDTVSAVFFCDVPTFTPETAEALAKFVRAGGVVWFFPGPEANLADYNARFGAKGAKLLPGRLGEPVGQVGPGAGVLAVTDVAEEHPLFKDLFEKPADYRTTRVQRYVPFQPSPVGARVLMTLEDFEPLLVEKSVGRGRAIWCMTTADSRWTNFPAQPIFLPMVVRSVMQSARTVAGPAMYSAGQTVDIQPGRRARGATKLRITLPGDDDKTKPQTLPREKGIARFTQTNQLGVYRWEALNPAGKVLAGGAFAVNPYGPESDLQACTPEHVQAELRNRGIARAYVATTLKELQTTATADAQGRNFWDILTAAAILLLLVEAVAANRRKTVASSS